MLQRGHSDFAWFRERAQSLHSDSVSHYTEMASNMIEEQGQLNPEPSQPEERAEHSLPPKSYAEAISNETNEQTEDAFGNKSDGEQKSAVNGYAHAPMVNGHKDRYQLDEDKVVYEKHVNQNGEVFTSIKPSENYEQSLQHNGTTAPREKHHRPAKRQDELASGRKAGEGWEKSAYV